MKNKIIFTILLLTFVSINKIKAQFVTIPDSYLAYRIYVYFPSCINGNVLDTTCGQVVNATSFDFSNAQITDLTGIQYFDNLTNLSVSYNNITSLGALPKLVNSISCQNNQITTIAYLPDSLKILRAENNQLTSLPPLPEKLWQLVVSNNNLTSLPALPQKLQILQAATNNLTSLPTLSDSLQVLAVAYNQLTSLPTLPDSLNTLASSDNQLTSLGTLPSAMTYLDCSNNNISCFAPFPSDISISSIFTFNVSNNPFTCLPNYFTPMNQSLLAYPLCAPGNLSNNENECPIASGVAGYVYSDTNQNCSLDSFEVLNYNIPVFLYDSLNNLLSQTYTLNNGIYNFALEAGAYKLAIDTSDVPYMVNCPNFASDTNIVLTSSIQFANNVNFPISCKPGFDIGVNSIAHLGIVFPGQVHAIKVSAGDISQLYGLNCANGISGTVIINVTGPVTYVAPSSGSLIPTINGNIFTYNVADFGSVSFNDDFYLYFSVNTSAQAADQICVTVTVTPSVGDNNQSNNSMTYCYLVLNSYDPNIKETFPQIVSPSFQDYFYYTIHFQNTGNAPAINIHIEDTLDANLDLSTFEITNSSHNKAVWLTGNNLSVNFPNIQLIDSTTNEPASHGFVQYKIKPVANLQNGTIIHNRASIFFDFNPPILTNTTQNLFTSPTSDNKFAYKNDHLIQIFPNPSFGSVSININKARAPYTLDVYNVIGNLMNTFNLTNSLTTVNLDHLEKGIYILELTDTDDIKTNSKLIID